jgi:hypothetical protein
LALDLGIGTEIVADVPVIGDREWRQFLEPGQELDFSLKRRLGHLISREANHPFRVDVQDQKIIATLTGFYPAGNVWEELVDSVKLLSILLLHSPTIASDRSINPPIQPRVDDGSTPRQLA